MKNFFLKNCLHISAGLELIPTRSKNLISLISKICYQIFLQVDVNAFYDVLWYLQEVSIETFMLIALCWSNFMVILSFLIISYTVNECIISLLKIIILGLFLHILSVHWCNTHFFMSICVIYFLLNFHSKYDSRFCLLAV